MTPERWQQTKMALEDALRRQGAERGAFLEDLARQDPQLCREVESLLAVENTCGEHFLETPATGLADLLPAPPGAVGRRLGSWQLVERIGEGGMGEVYKAVRADDEYQRVVAVKLVHSAAAPAFVAARLRAERQILANLQHPNIAQLLDGGTSEDGTAYIVMELVDGIPIDRYCEQSQLDVDARLRLFLRVCAAVQHAHQSMVIHRDLKPSNILVTREGVPKLLDFGIAKILEPTDAGARDDGTLVTLRILTPQYASPEQIRGDPVTAASDVYSLGVLLYELLTGTRPFAISERESPQSALSSLTQEPRRPSTVIRRRPSANASGRSLARRLKGDLDKITLMALRAEPERRYATVEQLAQDIRRHLEHLPVTARSPTIGYVVSRFAARHTFGVIASGLLVAVLGAGIFMTVRAERSAEAHRARAEQRFTEIRKLANSLIFDLYDNLEDLPGATRSRRLLVSTALQYLAGLRQEAANDPTLQLNMAAAYKRLGDIQGTLQSSDDDYAGALTSYQRALELVQTALAARPDDTKARLEVALLYNNQSDVQWILGHGAEAIALSRQALAQVQQVSRDLDETQKRFYLPLYGIDVGYKVFRVQGRSQEALGAMRPALDILERSWREQPGDPRLRRLLAVTYYKLAEVQLQERRYTEALDLTLNARRLLGEVRGTGPVDGDIQVNEAAAQHYSAEALMNLGRLDEATRLEQTALATVRSLVAADPNVAEFHGFVGMALIGLAEIALKRQDPAGAVTLLEEALQESRIALAAGTLHPYIRYSNGQAQNLLGQAYATIAADSNLPRKRQLQARQQACDAYKLAKVAFASVTPIWAQAADGTRQATQASATCTTARRD